MVMNKKLKMAMMGVLLAGLVVGLLSWSLPKEQVVAGNDVGQNSAQQGVKSLKKERQAKKKRNRVAVPVLISKGGRKGERPNVFEDVDEAELTDLARKVLLSLQQALDTENYSEIKDILAMCSQAPRGSLSKSGKSGPAVVPVMLRRKLVEAMGWFGAEAIPELVEFIADADEDVSQMAKDQFQLALEDISLSDYERAQIVVLAAQAVTDSDFLDQVFAEINNMRHSVGASTLVNICENGTEPAKALMPDAIEFFTGEDNIQTVEDVEKWLEANPDGPDDDDLYGGSKDE